MGSSELDRASDLFDFLDRYLRDVERGGARPLAEYLARFPGREEEIAREWLARRRGAAVSAPPADGAEPAAAQAGAEDALGRYEVVRTLGRGGQGVVELARDSKLGRLVALKRVEGLAGLSASRVERLRREVAIVAGLDHPSICAVYEAHLDEAPYFVAMRYVEGETVAELLERARAGGEAWPALPLPPRTRREVEACLLVFERIALALHAAHEAGVAHRDVKPANLMVDEAGAPVVLDFGLARAEESSALTRAGDVFGTPAYMSPEQVRGEALDRRTDVWSLGATLFECLTLRRPFAAAERRTLEQAILADPAPDPRWHAPHLPADLSVVVATALEKHRERRYASALALALDLRRVRTFEPIHARPAGPLLRLRRWARRSPRLAAAVLALFAVLTVGLATALLLLAQVRRERDRNEGEFLASLAREEVVRAPDRALLFAIEASRLAAGWQSRNALYAALDGVLPERWLPGTPTGDSAPLDASPDGRLLALGVDDGAVEVRDVADGGVVARLVGHTDLVRSARFDPAGERVVTASNDGTARIWSARTGTELARLEGHADWVRDARFSPDGTRVATASDDDTARVFDAATGGELAILRGHEGRAVQVLWDDAGTRVLTRSGLSIQRASRDDGTARLFDAATGAQLRVLRGHAQPLDLAVLLDGGARAATVSLDGTLRLWPLDSDGPPTVVELGGEAYAVASSPDGTLLAVGYERGDPPASGRTGLELRDARSGALVRRLRGHDGRPASTVSFSADGARLLSGSWYHGVRVWDVASGALLVDLPAEGFFVQDARWIPHSERVVACGGSGTRIWDLRRPRGLVSVAAHEGAALALAFRPGGGLLASAGEDGAVRLWDPASGEAEGTPLSGDAEALRVDWSPDGARLVAAWRDGRARAAAIDDGPEVELPRHAGAVTCASFAPREERVLTTGEDGAVRIVDPASGAVLLALAEGGAPVDHAAWSHDGALVATESRDRGVRVYDAESGELLHAIRRWEDSLRVRGRSRFHALAFSDDGRLLATSGEDLHVRVHDARGGELVLDERANAGALAFVAGGSELMYASRWVSAVSFLPLAGGPSPERDLPQAGRITGLVLDAARERALTTSLDGTACVWDLDRHAPHALLRGHDAGVLCGAFSDDGRWIATADERGIVRVWPSDPLAAAVARTQRALTEREHAPLGLGRSR